MNINKQLWSKLKEIMRNINKLKKKKLNKNLKLLV